MTIVYATGFNRDIVECKDNTLLFGVTMTLLRFNRDIVECKGSNAGSQSGRLYRFNRDIVECKGAYRIGELQRKVKI